MIKVKKDSMVHKFGGVSDEMLVLCKAFDKPYKLVKYLDEV